MAVNDLDPYYIKCISQLFSKDHLLKKEQSPLQRSLEDAIKSKTGITKDFSSLIPYTYSNVPMDDMRSVVHTIDDSKSNSSVNDLELDLFNDDILCVVCNHMDVVAGNRLVECVECHMLYHQECHRPPITSADAEGMWMCHNCKSALKKPSTPSTIPSHPVASSSTSSKSKMFTPQKSTANTTHNK